MAVIVAALDPNFSDAFVQGLGVGLLAWLFALAVSVGVRLLRRTLST